MSALLHPLSTSFQMLKKWHVFFQLSLALIFKTNCVKFFYIIINSYIDYIN